MFDSLNYIIRNVMQLDFNHICKLGKIRIKPFQKVNKNTGYKNSCYEFNYKTIEFKYNSNTKILVVITNAHNILNKEDITLSDRDLYEQRVNQIVSEILNTTNFQLEVSRVDYCIDLKLDDLISPYLLLQKYNKKKYKHMKVEIEYGTSLYMKNKHGKTNINFYNRYAKTGQEKDKGIMRYELQCKKKLIKTEYDRYGIDKELSNYWSESAMQEYYFDYLYDFLYEGDFYKYETAKKMINDSDYTLKTKSKLRKFLRDVEKETMSILLEENKYSVGKFQNRVDKLNELHINPIPIPQGYKYEKLDSLYNMLQEKAKRDYFV